MTTAALAFDGATLGYDGQAIVHDLDLVIAPGEVVALLGGNGAGKSTLVRSVVGLSQVLHGTVRALGHPVGHLPEPWRVGYVPQRHTLAGGIPATVEEVVGAGRLTRRRPWQRATDHDRRRVSEAIATVGLPGLERAIVNRLSGGQQRRVLVARSLAGDAELLLLDEPTAGVDAAHQEAMADTLATLAGRGTTIVLVAHELGPFAPVITRVVILAGGAVVDDHPHGPQDVDDPSHRHDDHPDHHAHDAAPQPASDPFGFRTG